MELSTEENLVFQLDRGRAALAAGNIKEAAIIGCAFAAADVWRLTTPDAANGIPAFQRDLLAKAPEAKEAGFWRMAKIADHVCSRCLLGRASMDLFSSPDFDHHEQVVFCSDPHTGLKAIIAIHNTHQGPALGGCRMWAYASEDAALTDALRLSRGMTYKSALADLPLGGGKSVIIGNAKTDKTPALMRAMGEAIERLSGRYIVAEDVGTNALDMAEIRQATRHVAGLSPEFGGGGDPSPATAYGVFLGIKESVRAALGTDSLKGVRVAIQGLGSVGFDLCRALHEAGASLIVTDIMLERVQKAESLFGAQAVGLTDIYSAEADIFAPCALGAILNDETIPLLKAKIIAGSANNQLAQSRHGLMLHERGILYAPDYAINAGGIINVCYEYLGTTSGGYDRDKAFAHIAHIPQTLAQIYAQSRATNRPTHEIADALALHKLSTDKEVEAKADTGTEDAID